MGIKYLFILYLPLSSSALKIQHTVFKQLARISWQQLAVRRRQILRLLYDLNKIHLKNKTFSSDLAKLESQFMEFQYQVTIMDWNISPESSSLSCLLGWNPSWSSFNSNLLSIIDWNNSPESSCLPCLLGWNPNES